MKKNYESIRAFLVTGLFVCTCAAAQAQTHTDEAIQLTFPAGHSSLAQSLFDTKNPAEINTVTVGMAQYARLIEKLESDSGPFDARLREPLLALGAMLSKRGDYHEAVSYIERALYILRIDQGLYSEPQIAIIERLIELNVALEDWKAVDENFRYLELLYTRLFKQGGLKWDYGIAKVVDWHIIAINNNLGDGREEHLREANKLSKLRLVYAEQDESVDQRVIGVLRHNIKYTAYHLRKQEEEIKTERCNYSRFKSHCHDDRVDGLASVD